MKAAEKVMSHQPVASEIKRIIETAIPWAVSNKHSTTARPSTTGNNHKGQRGRIGVIGGSRDYTGAPYFAAISAMRLGADLTYVLCTKDASPVIKTYSPELIVIPLLDSDDYMTEIDCTLSKLHSVVIGPGLGRDKAVHARVIDALARIRAKNLPVVIDADGLLLINSDPKIISGYNRAILTPNRIELERLLNAVYNKEPAYNLRQMSIDEIREAIVKCSYDLNVTIMAKGPEDIIVSPPTDKGGSSFMLTMSESLGSSRRCGGQGDLLSGMTAALTHWMLDSKGSTVYPLAWASYFAANITRYCNQQAYIHDGRDGFLLGDMLKHINKARTWLMTDYLAPNNRIDNENITTKESRVPYDSVFTADEVARYSRQMMMPEIGAVGQSKLKKSSVLIIGCGGLGCPSSVYLAAAGIGTIGLVDHDHVEINNLHRQILHKVSTIGKAKTDSIVEPLDALNPEVKYVKHTVKLSSANAVDLVEKYDIVIDATDNLKTRYMISDACALARKPLVSGAALRLDGQLTVYGFDDHTPCFRCLFPVPPPSDSVRNCSDTGVLGVIPGIIGCLQALEAIKIAAGIRPAYAGRMLLFDGMTGNWRNIQLAGRKSECPACGSNAKDKIGRHLIDYDKFCGTPSCSRPVEILHENERVSVQEYKKLVDSFEPHVLVDVRPDIQTQVSHLKHAITIPLMKLNDIGNIKKIEQALDEKKSNKIFVMCRRGIASQTAVRVLQEIFDHRERQVQVKDLEGGATAWAQKVDPKFPVI